MTQSSVQMILIFVVVDNYGHVLLTKIILAGYLQKIQKTKTFDLEKQNNWYCLSSQLCLVKLTFVRLDVVCASLFCILVFVLCSN